MAGYRRFPFSKLPSWSLLALSGALLAAASVPAEALELEEVRRFAVASVRPPASPAEIRLSVAEDGNALLGWTIRGGADRPETVWVQWLSPDGSRIGRPVRAVGDGELVALAPRPGQRALVLSRPSDTGSDWRLTFLKPSGVAAQVDPAAIGCQYPYAAAATGSGYFLACSRFEGGSTGWWLDDRPFAVRGRVELGDVSRVSLAGGPGTGVALFYQDLGGRILARWMTLWNQRAPILVDRQVAGLDGSITRLGDREFGLAWVYEHAVGSDPEWPTRLTAVHAATFEVPRSLRSRGRFSRLEGSADDSTGEQTRPVMLPIAPGEQVVSWFRCSYMSGPGARLVCPPNPGLLLRERLEERPAGSILEMPGVPPGTVLAFTGERVVTARIVDRTDGGWHQDLQVRVYALK